MSEDLRLPPETEPVAWETTYHEDRAGQRKRMTRLDHEPDEPVDGELLSRRALIYATTQESAEVDETLRVMERVDRLLEHLFDRVPWSKTAGVDFKELNEAPLELKKQIARLRDGR